MRTTEKEIEEIWEKEERRENAPFFCRAEQSRQVVSGRLAAQKKKTRRQTDISTIIITLSYIYVVSPHTHHHDPCASPSPPSFSSSSSLVRVEASCLCQFVSVRKVLRGDIATKKITKMGELSHITTHQAR